jgi:hypothetical protein
MVIPEDAARLMGAGTAEAEQYGPINTLRNMGAATQDVFEQAKRAYEAGDYGSAAIKTFFGLLPVVGPDFNQMGDHARAGEWGKVAADVGGTGVAIAAPGVINAAATRVSRLAPALEARATAKTVDTMVPKVGPNKRKFGNMAVDVAPRVVRETTAVTRPGMLDQVVTKLDDASAALEAAYDAVPTRRTYATRPIKDAIDVAMKNLAVEGVKGTVEPATRAARLAALKQARAEVEALGAVTNLPNLRKLRQSWDEGAKAVFTPDIAADAMKLKNAGYGWADARSAVSDYLASKHPELKPLNADVSVWIKARDVLQAAEEIERVRPTVGRSIMARGLGAATGAAGAGVPGAIAGAVVAPVVERVLANLQPSMRVIAARQMAKLADALRAGNQARVTQTLKTLEMLAPATAAVNVARDVSALPRAAERREEPKQ